MNKDIKKETKHLEIPMEMMVDLYFLQGASSVFKPLAESAQAMLNKYIGDDPDKEITEFKAKDVMELMGVMDRCSDVLITLKENVDKEVKDTLGDVPMESLIFPKGFDVHYEIEVKDEETDSVKIEKVDAEVVSIEE